MRLTVLALFATFFSLVACESTDTVEETPVASNTITQEKAQPEVLPEHDPVYDTFADGNLPLPPASELPAVPPLTQPDPDYAKVRDEVRKEAEEFQIDPSRDTVLYCAEGTRLEVAAQTFASPRNGLAVSSLVTLKVTEYYRYADMLLAGLSTFSKRGLLESGGMLYVEALAKGESLEIAEGKEVQFGFPKQGQPEDMKLFIGDWDRDEQVTWTLASEHTPGASSSRRRPQNGAAPGPGSSFNMIQQQPTFPGGEAALFQFLGANVKYPQIAREAGIQGTVYVQFEVTETGSIDSAWIARGLDKVCDREVLRVIKRMPTWQPAIQAGRPVETIFTLPVRFRLETARRSSGSGTANPAYQAQFDSIYNDNNVGQASVRDMEYYVFASAELGWVNCDRWYNVQDKVNMMVQVPNDGSTEVKMIFHNFRAIQRGTPSAEGLTFTQIPNNEPVTLFSIRFKNGETQIASTQTTTSDNPNFTLDYRTVTMEELKLAAEDLNQFTNQLTAEAR